MSTSQRMREVLSVLGALAIGPLFQVFGNWAGLMFAVAGAFYFLVCAAILPLLTYAGGRLKFIVWQLAVLDLVLSAVGGSLWARIFQGGSFPVSGTLREAYGVWFWGVLLSSPLPIYFILQPLSRRRRFEVGFVIIMIALGLFLGGVIIVR